MVTNRKHNDTPITGFLVALAILIGFTSNVLPWFLGWNFGWIAASAGVGSLLGLAVIHLAIGSDTPRCKGKGKEMSRG